MISLRWDSFTLNFRAVDLDSLSTAFLLQGRAEVFDPFAPSGEVQRVLSEAGVLPYCLILNTFPSRLAYNFLLARLLYRLRYLHVQGTPWIPTRTGLTLTKQIQKTTLHALNTCHRLWTACFRLRCAAIHRPGAHATVPGSAMGLMHGVQNVPAADVT